VPAKQWGVCKVKKRPHTPILRTGGQREEGWGQKTLRATGELLRLEQSHCEGVRRKADSIYRNLCRALQKKLRREMTEWRYGTGLKNKVAAILAPQKKRRGWEKKRYREDCKKKHQGRRSVTAGKVGLHEKNQRGPFTTKGRKPVRRRGGVMTRGERKGGGAEDTGGSAAKENRKKQSRLWHEKKRKSRVHGSWEGGGGVRDSWTVTNSVGCGVLLH